MHSIDFHAHHAAPGAYASFTCGRFRAGGGMNIMGNNPAKQELVIGWAEGEQVHVLPFVKQDEVGLSMEAFGDTTAGRKQQRTLMTDGLVRDYRRGTDTWTQGDFAFTVFTTAPSLPDPAVAGADALARAGLPAVAARLTLDNRNGKTQRTLIFAIGPGTTCHTLDRLGDDRLGAGLRAVGWGRELAIATAEQPGLGTLIEWSEGEFLVGRRVTHLGGMCGFVLDVAPGQVGTLDLALCFHRAGLVTSGIDAAFYYLRSYPTLESVCREAVARHSELRAAAAALDADARWNALDAHRRFLVAHAERSYWGNTWLLERAGEPLWCVLEGEYGMHNTFDLTVDMAFYELARNPWTVRNTLDFFVERYAFHDTLARPAADAHRKGHHTFARNPHRIFDYVTEPAETGLPGGISFCHDQGVNGHFTAPGTSSYESSRLAGCFSHMTCEQLYNWILVAAGYWRATRDTRWLHERAPVIRACLTSALNRDDPVPARRNGLNGLDSTRCEGGWEITTYDSLDPSLGQARNNLYMGVKGWAAYVGLGDMLAALNDAANAAEAGAGAQRAAAAVAAQFDAKLGYIPAVFEYGNTSAIIPAIEGLVYPLVWGMADAVAKNGTYAGMIAALDQHLRAILKPGTCLCADGGWKLSSTSDNTWVSKIFLSQVVAERVFGLAPSAASHAAHAHWQQVGCADWAMTDQIIKGTHTGSRYYPRCVTADLWLHPTVA